MDPKVMRYANGPNSGTASGTSASTGNPTSGSSIRRVAD